MVEYQRPVRLGRFIRSREFFSGPSNELMNRVCPAEAGLAAEG